jgi:hypothetical protein
MGNYDVYSDNGTLLTSSPKDEYYIGFVGGSVYYLVENQIRQLNPLTGNDSEVTWKTMF